MTAANDHTSAMPKKARSFPKPQRQKTQINAWRKYRGLSLAKLSERLEVEEGYEISEGQLSRIERAEQPYSQDLLDAIARIMRCGPQDLINVDPAKGGGIWSIWEGLSEPQRDQAVQLLKVLKGSGTGTEG